MPNPQGPIVLPKGVLIVPIASLPEEVRAKVNGQDGDFAVTRPMSRAPSKIVDADGAALLKLFDQPKTLVDALVEYSRIVHRKPTEVLEDAFPLIESCLLARLLVEPGVQAESIEPTHVPGAQVAAFTVVKNIQTLEDSEVYKASDPSGAHVALKLARPQAVRRMEWLLRREEAALRRLKGVSAPALLEFGFTPEGLPFLASEWIDGTEAALLAAEHRQRGGARLTEDMAGLASAVVSAYASIHSAGVIHGDVHPRNVLVERDGSVKLIDFGLCRFEGEGSPSPRGGIGFFFEPEYAIAAAGKSPPPASTMAGEQYSVAALVYFLLAGAHYVDFDLDEAALLRQICSAPPVPLALRGVQSAGRLEAALFRALQKDPHRRFRSTARFASAVRQAARDAAPDAPAIAHGTSPERLMRSVLLSLEDHRRPIEARNMKAPIASVTYGSAGLAYALLRLAGALEDPRFLALADLWIERAASESGAANAFYEPSLDITSVTVGEVTPYHTASGISIVRALLAASIGDGASAGEAVAAYCAQTDAPCPNPDLTLGRSGVLLGLTLLAEACALTQAHEFTTRGHRLLDEIWSDLDAKPPIAATGDYLGIAHGWAGYLFAALRWTRAVSAEPRASWQSRLNELACLAQITRRGAYWPVQASGGLSACGWCNGSAGHAHLWTLAFRVYGDSRYLDLAQRAAHDAFEGAGGTHTLCCGFASQAYAQLLLYQLTADSQWLRRARTLAERAAETSFMLAAGAEPFIPMSLYKGDAGLAVLIAELARPDTAALPLFAE